MSGPRALVVGLDCAPPALVFDRYHDAMPNLARLCERGLFGPLRSTTPPITIPAWTSMFTGLSPGALGLYGFSRQVAGSYTPALVDADDVLAPRVWELLRGAGHRVASLFVPPSYPPSAHADLVVSCFLTPGPDVVHTHPKALGETLAARFGEYVPDVADFRDGDRARILEALLDGSEQRFDIARYLWTRERPDFMAMVDIGPDRLHHAFYRDIDPAHPRHDPNDPFVDAGQRYYAFLDRQLGALLSEVDDDTLVLVVSDHGARSLRGGVCVNEWLLRRGYLVLRSQPTEVTPLAACEVDWARTRAWASGGYCGRVYLNRRGLRPEGCVSDADAPALLAELAAGLGAIEAPGSARPHRVLRAEEAYPEGTVGIAPDLSVFFGDLDLRAIGSLGHPGLFTEGDDRGDDGCNHDWDGVFAVSGAGTDARGAVGRRSILDVAPTLLGHFGLDAPPGLSGSDLRRA